MFQKQSADILANRRTCTEQDGYSKLVKSNSLYYLFILYSQYTLPSVTPRSLEAT